MTPAGIVTLAALVLPGCGDGDPSGPGTEVDEPIVSARMRVDVIEPGSKAILRDTSVLLKWSSAGEEGVSYAILLDTVSPPARLHADDAAETSYVAKGLNYGEMYFWRVIASHDDVSDTSAVWTLGTMVRGFRGRDTLVNPPALYVDTVDPGLILRIDTTVLVESTRDTSWSSISEEVYDSLLSLGDDSISGTVKADVREYVVKGVKEIDTSYVIRESSEGAFDTAATYDTTFEEVGTVVDTVGFLRIESLFGTEDTTEQADTVVITDTLSGITDMVVDNPDSAWYITWDGTLAAYGRTTKSLTLKETVWSANSLVKDTVHDCFWIGTDYRGLVRYTSSSIRYFNLDNGLLPDNRIFGVSLRGKHVEAFTPEAEVRIVRF